MLFIFFLCVKPEYVVVATAGFASYVFALRLIGSTQLFSLLSSRVSSILGQVNESIFLVDVLIPIHH